MGSIGAITSLVFAAKRRGTENAVMLINTFFEAPEKNS
jgi:hypothetical protein